MVVPQNVHLLFQIFCASVSVKRFCVTSQEKGFEIFIHFFIFKSKFSSILYFRPFAMRMFNASLFGSMCKSANMPGSLCSTSGCDSLFYKTEIKPDDKSALCSVRVADRCKKVAQQLEEIPPLSVENKEGRRWNWFAAPGRGFPEILLCDDIHQHAHIWAASSVCN